MLTKAKHNYLVNCKVVNGGKVLYKGEVEVQAYSEKQAKFMAGNKFGGYAIIFSVKDKGEIVPEGMKLFYGSLVEEEQVTIEDLL